MQSVLIIGKVWVEKTTGAGNRMWQLIELFLAENYKITFASTAQKTAHSVDLYSFGIDEVSIQLNDASFDDFITKLQPNIVVFDRFMTEEQFGWRVAENYPNALRILDTEDLHFLRKTRYEQLKKDEDFSDEALLKSDDAKREIASILRCDLSLIISSFEMVLLKKLLKIDERLLLHLPFLLDKITPETTQNWENFSERKHFVFVGNFFHQPNVDAVLQLKKHIWSNIKKTLPEAELHIYGAYVNQQIQELHKPSEGFFIKGFAEDINQVVENAKVVLAPIRFGAGIKGKLTEAMVLGTPSVTTKIGAEGMHNNLPWNGFITDNFEEFVTKSVELYTDENFWKQSQKNGFEIINQLYDKKKLGVTFMERVTQLKQNLQSHRTQNFLGGLLQHKTLQASKYLSKWIEAKNKN